MQQRTRPSWSSEPYKIDLVRRIDLTTLRLFIAICEEGNLTRASQREAIAPSAVSKRMHDLEQALGVALFERQPNGMALTPAGELLLHHARVTLLNIEKIAVDMAEHARGVRGHIRMLANLSSIVEFLPDDLPGFFARTNWCGLICRSVPAPRSFAVSRRALRKSGSAPLM